MKQVAGFGLIVCAGLLVYGIYESHARYRLLTATTNKSAMPIGSPEAIEQDPLSCSGKKFSDKDLNLAALEVLWTRLDRLRYRFNSSDLNRARTKLVAVRTWVEGLPDGKVRNAYMYWVNFYGNQYDDSEKELAKVPEEKSERQKEESERQAERERVLELSQCLPKPPKAQRVGGLMGPTGRVQ